MRGFVYVLAMLSGAVTLLWCAAMLVTGVGYEPNIYVKVPEIIFMIIMGLVLGYRGFVECGDVYITDKEYALIFGGLLALLAVLLYALFLHGQMYWRW